MPRNNRYTKINRKEERVGGRWRRNCRSVDRPNKKPKTKNKNGLPVSVFS